MKVCDYNYILTLFLTNVWQQKAQGKSLLGVRTRLRRWPGDCSEEQLAALNNFRIFAIELNGGQPNPQWDDHYLLRFLRARKFKKEETQLMWKNFIEWRTKNDIDNAFVQIANMSRNSTYRRSSNSGSSTRTDTTK